ncbi:piwi-like protein 1 isoform X2 [Tubulanus polymorphus]
MRWVEKTTRPAHCVDKCGGYGAPQTIIANFFKLESAPSWNLYQYHVDFKPQVDSKRVRIAMVKSQSAIIGPVSAFDGMVLFLPRKLEKNPTVYLAEKEYDNSKVEITMTLTAELPPSNAQCLQLFNVILRRALNSIGMKQIGRQYYCPDDAKDIERHRMQVWPGYSTSILQYETSVMMCADLSHKVLRTLTVKDMMEDLHRNCRGNFHDEATKALVGEIVLTRYNNKTYRIDDIDWTKNPACKFNTRDGDISFIDYYQKAYSKRILDAGQPLLISKPKASDKRRGMTEDILLVPELCVLTGLSDQMRSDFNVMKDLAVYTRVGPQDRREKLGRFVELLSSNAEVQKDMSGWGLKFAKTLLEFQGRVLPVEKIFQRDKSFGYKQDEADWSREMRGAKLITSVNLENWIVVCTKKDSQAANDLCQNLKKVGPAMGIMVGNPNVIELMNDRLETYKAALQSSIKPTTQIVMIMVPSNRKDRYDAIKKFCCVDHPVPSQVVVTRTVLKAKGLMSVATKIIIQMNCKLGGEVWALDVPLKKLMVVGIDSYHDSSQRGLSVGAFIASMNNTLTKYYSRAIFQHNHQELQDGLRVCMKDALSKYHEVNGELPERIFIYRDGVGDGQLAAVHEHEIAQLLKCFELLKVNYVPKMTFIVVKKRISQRFFAIAGRNACNPLPGTIVDKEVTKPEWYDFFLVSQSVRQGTVSPTHYNVIHDTSGLKPDHIQRLTYKLTHLYYNWPGTIRVPAPCQYAHKLAFLVGQSIHKEPSPNLADRLYFL